MLHIARPPARPMASRAARLRWQSAAPMPRSVRRQSRRAATAEVCHGKYRARHQSQSTRARAVPSRRACSQAAARSLLPPPSCPPSTPPPPSYPPSTPHPPASAAQRCASAAGAACRATTTRARSAGRAACSTSCARRAWKRPVRNRSTSAPSPASLASCPSSAACLTRGAPSTCRTRSAACSRSAAQTRRSSSSSTRRSRASRVCTARTPQSA